MHPAGLQQPCLRHAQWKGWEQGFILLGLSYRHTLSFHNKLLRASSWKAALLSAFPERREGSSTMGKQMKAGGIGSREQPCSEGTMEGPGVI